MHQNKFYPYLGLSYPYPGKGIAHTMKYEPNRGIPCQLWPTTMSTSTNNHISSLRTCWQPLHLTNNSGNNNQQIRQQQPPRKPPKTCWKLPRDRGNAITIFGEQSPWLESHWETLKPIGENRICQKQAKTTTKQEKGHQEVSRAPKTTKIDGG